MGSRAALDSNHCGSNDELMFRFFIWALGISRVPLPEEIVTEFSVSVATAYRWRNAWCDARGLPIPPQRESGCRPEFIKQMQRAQMRARSERKRSESEARRQPAPVQTPIEGQ